MERSHILCKRRRVSFPKASEQQSALTPTPAKQLADRAQLGNPNIRILQNIQHVFGHIVQNV
jgi:hypothetical protein